MRSDRAKEIVEYFIEEDSLTDGILSRKGLKCVPDEVYEAVRDLSEGEWDSVCEMFAIEARGFVDWRKVSRDVAYYRTAWERMEPETVSRGMLTEALLARKYDEFIPGSTDHHAEKRRIEANLCKEEYAIEKAKKIVEDPPGWLSDNPQPG